MGEHYRCEVATSLAEVMPHVAAWEELQRRSLEDNIYLSPSFLIASLRHFGHEHPYYVVFVYSTAGGKDRLIGCAPFSLLAPSWKVPLSALSTLVSPHVFLSHPLLDRDLATSALGVLWDWIEQPGQAWGLVVLRHMNARSPAWPLIVEELRRRRLQYWVKEVFQRAMLQRHESFEAYVASLSSKRRKNYRQKWRRLHALGSIEVVLHRNLRSVPDLATRFMAVEQRSWKGRQGSALAQSAADSAFLSEITRELGERDQLFFVELKLNGRPIAISANFVLGRTLFGFKTGYDSEFKEFSPGILMEIECVQFFHESPELTTGESGAAGHIFLDAYWRDVADMQLVYISTHRYQSRAYVRLIPLITRVKRAVANSLMKFSRRLEATKSGQG